MTTQFDGRKTAAKKSLLLIAFFLFAALKAHSQTAGGTVLDENGEPLPFVTVSLRTLPDSAIVNGGITDIEGKFKIEGKSAWNIAQFSMIGYGTMVFPASDFTKAGVTVNMKPDTKMLDEVVITGILPKTEVKGNAVVTSVAGSVLEHYGNAQNVLDKVPGMITIGDKLQVLGRGEPEIYINGRKMTDESELRNLMASDIKSVEVISNPGAAYGGDVRSVVIIRTVKRQGDGFSYALTSQARQHIYNNHDFDPSWTVLDLNYRKGGWDLFGKLVYWNQRNYQSSDVDGGSIVRINDMIMANTQVGPLDGMSHNGGFQYIAGANWQIDDNNSIGMKLGFDDNTISNGHLVMEDDIFKNGILVDHLLAVNDSHADVNTQWNGNLYYDGTAGKLHINFNADFISGVYKNKTSVTETSWLAPVSMTSASNSLLDMKAGKLILSYPVWKGQLQAGMEETYVHASEEYSITNTDIPQSDAFLTENTLAAFSEYSVTLPIGQLSAGLRAEHVNFAYTDRMESKNDLRRKQDNWFPSFSFSTKAGPVSMNLSYTGKTIRPQFNQLSNEITYDNRYAYQSGDPTMKNEIHRTLALNASWQWVNVSAAYENVKNCFAQWASPYNDEGVVMLSYINADVPLQKLTAYVNASPVVGVWNPRATIGMEKQFLSMTLSDPRVEGGERTVTANKPMFVIQLDNAFNFRHNWALDIDYQYLSRFNDLLSLVSRPMQRLDIGLSKSFLEHEALTARISCTDLLNATIPYYETDFGCVFITQSNDYYRPCVELRLSYRFNSANSKYKGTGAGQSAKERM